MKADSDPLIAGGGKHSFARNPSRRSRKPWSDLSVSKAARLAAARHP